MEIMNKIFLPYPVINIILSYSAGLNNMKWTPLVDHQTGKLKWNINKHNQSTLKIENVLKFKLQNPPYLIPLLCGSFSCDALLTMLSKKNDIKYKYYNYIWYMLEYERNGFTEQAIFSVYKNEDDSYIIFNKNNNYLFRDYLPDPSFWISNIKGIIWNDYGITLIIMDNMDGWHGDWIYLENEWRFNIELPPEFLDLNQDPFDDFDP